MIAQTVVDSVTSAAYAAAEVTLVAALIHLWVAPEHFGHWWGYGVFFLVGASAQALVSVPVLRFPQIKPVLLAGVAGNLLIVALYVVSSAWGMPFDPSVARLEDTASLGMTATTAEVGIVIALTVLLTGAPRRFAINALLLAGVSLWGPRLAGVLP